MSTYLSKSKHAESGVTLLETLLYVSIAATLLIAITVFMWTLVEARVKNQTMYEVESQGRWVAEVITKTIRGAEAITSPAAGTTGGSLTVTLSESADSPTTFAESDGTLTISEGGGAPMPLTNSRVTVSDLTFQNLTKEDTPGIVRVSYTITYINTEDRYEYDYAHTFRTSASVR